MKVLYTAGSGNAFACFGDFLADREDVATSHVAYSRQFFEACHRHGLSARVTCSFSAGISEMAGRGIELRYRPDVSRGKSGIAFQLSQFTKARQVMAEARDFGADLVILSEDALPALYAPLKRRGVHIVQSLHTLLHSGPQSLMQRLRLRSYRGAYRKTVSAVLSASDAVSRQVRDLSGGQACPIHEFLPLYPPQAYADVPKADPHAPRLGILYIGRVEANKGALDLVEIARLCRARGLGLAFHICGIGGALADMQALVARHGLDENFVFHGWCDQRALAAVMAQCQIVVVPTRSEIGEGFNHVVVEAVLAGRLALASDVCPAPRYLGAAARAARSDDPVAFADEIEAFASDRARLATALAATAGAAERFTDPAQSYGAALDAVFSALREGREVPSRQIALTP